jgi:hypothetical protein
LNVVDLTNLHSYLDAGGQLFITGMGAADSDGNWVAIALGAEASVSAYDNLNNDPNKQGGISPPQPSAAPDTGVGPLQRAGIFAGLKPIDFSTKGDGAGDNLAIRNTALDSFGLDGLVGVPGLTPLSGKFGTDNANKPANAYGQPALKMTNPSNSDGGSEVAVVSSDEPSLKHTASYPGRSVLFSFGFEGINDNTGYATREQVLQRIFAWFADHPTARVASMTYRSGARVQLKATFRAQGATPAEYIWQVGKTVLSASSKATNYRFPHAGRYRLRVQITDTLGHTAVSPWTTVTVH